MTRMICRIVRFRLGIEGIIYPHWRYGAAFAIFVCAALVIAPTQAAATTSRLTALGTLILWMPFIMKGFVLNVLMSVFAMTLATVLGLGLGLMQISQQRLVTVPARIITHLLRNSPWIVVLFIIMFLTPFQLALPNGTVVIIPDWVKATIAFSLPVTANLSEIFRGAVVSIPTGQWESAESLAFTRSQTLRWIILPQCFRRMIPSWMNWYALLAMSTPLASIMGVHEAVGNAQAAMEAAGGRPEYLLLFYGFLMGVFFSFIYPISVLTKKMELKYAITD